MKLSNLIGGAALTSIFCIAGATSAQAAVFAPGSEIQFNGIFELFSDGIDFYEGGITGTPDGFTSPATEGLDFTSGTFDVPNITAPGTVEVNDVTLPFDVVNDVKYDVSAADLALLSDFDNDSSPSPFDDDLEFVLTAFTRRQDSGSTDAFFDVEGFFRSTDGDFTPAFIEPATITFQRNSIAQNLDNLPGFADGEDGLISTYSATFIVANQVPEPGAVLGLVATLGIGAFASKNKKYGRKKA
ncbi:MAG: PEP-CTERM sorting domain-containing protein [Xenococcus sp. (in: cyanobacteria)]